MTEDVNWEQKYLDQLREHAADARNLYSNAQKPERERMVIRAFLRSIGVPFGDGDIKASADGEDEPVDVFFDRARFQVMVGLAGGKPQKEWKEREEKWGEAKSVDEVMEPWVTPEPATSQNASRYVASELAKKAAHYSDCSDIDALVYIDIPDRFLQPIDPSFDPKAVEQLKQQGWRSVSFLFVPCGAVLLAGDDAPDFLKEKAGGIWLEWKTPDIFEA